MRRVDVVEIRQEQWTLKTLAEVVSHGDDDVGGQVVGHWNPSGSIGRRSVAGDMAVEVFVEVDSEVWFLDFRDPSSEGLVVERTLASK